MDKDKKIILITGCAGFIGAALCKRFLSDGHEVFGIDNLNNYYDVKLKKDRLKNISYTLLSRHLGQGFWRGLIMKHFYKKYDNNFRWQKTYIKSQR